MSTVSVCQQRPPSALPAAPRFENRRCDPTKTEGEKKTDSPTHLKVANRSGFVVETLLGGAATPQGGQRAPLRGSCSLLSNLVLGLPLVAAALIASTL